MGACSYACNYLVFGNHDATTKTKPPLDNPDNYDPAARPPNVAPAYLPKVSSSFGDGLANTILFAEKLSICNWFMGGSTAVAQPGGNLWGPGGDSAQYAPAFAMESPWNDGTRFQVNPSAAECNAAYASTGHSKGMQVAMADGSARIMSPGISADLFKALCTPNGGEQIGPDW
jgi:prepilin-type processing-associated H-X9-DG protein